MSTVTVMAALCVAAGAGPRSATLVARPTPPTLAALEAGPARIRPLQGHSFRFTLGGAWSPAVAATVRSTAIADPEPGMSAVGEWGYSFHHLKGGQADGAGYRHYGGYARTPTTRAEAMAVVRRYYDRLRTEALARATPEQRRCFVSISGHYCYQHYAGMWGCDVVGSEVGENINGVQQHIAFTRGAARQFGKPWLLDFSSWFGPSILDEDPERHWGDNSGPDYGHSISLHRRAYYAGWMAGASVVVAEGGTLNCFASQKPGPDGTLPLSTLGRAAATFARFARRHPDRGVPYAPVALLLPVDHGIYPGFGDKLAWNALPYTRGDQAILDALHALFPGSSGDPAQPERADRQPLDPTWTDPDYMHTEALRMVASPHGDIADVLLSSAPEAVLRAYPLTVLAGDYRPSAALAARLGRYVARGGTLVLDRATLARGVLPVATARGLPLPPAGGFVRAARGQGAVVVMADCGPEAPTASRPLSRVLARARGELIPIAVTGTLETLYNRTRDGWLVTLINNGGVRKRFREAVRVDPRATVTASLRYTGPGRVRRAVLWGEEGDRPLSASPTQVTVGPGEVRIVRLVTRDDD
ncbi:MAG: hypothetical protein IT208_09930 [Chthonomonadales bacterium]|nr:hypothetical protein [Chthonomonadales bacterium]